MRTTLLLFLTLFALTACISGKARMPQYDSQNLYRAYARDDEKALALQGRAVNITGKISRIDQSLTRNLFIELDKRIVAFLRSDQVSKIGKLGLKEGESISLVGTFAGKSTITRWNTSSGNDILVLENAEIIGKQGLLPF